MAEQSIWVDAFPGMTGYYWVDDGRSIRMVYAEFQGGEWVVWYTLNNTENVPVHNYAKWSHRLVVPLPDDENTE